MASKRGCREEEDDQFGMAAFDGSGGAAGGDPFGGGGFHFEGATSVICLAIYLARSLAAVVRVGGFGQSLVIWRQVSR